MARTKDFDEIEVLGKAIDLFWHKGYNGTSMQDLVDGLGISRSSLYDTYGNKHTLFVKALESYQMRANEKISQLISQPAPVKETIKNLLEYMTSELLGDKNHKGCFMVNAEVEVAPHDKAISQIVCNKDLQMEDTFYMLIKKGQESGEITGGHDARALARFIFNTVKGMQVSSKTTADKAIFADIIKTAVTVLD